MQHECSSIFENSKQHSFSTNIIAHYIKKNPLKNKLKEKKKDNFFPFFAGKTQDGNSTFLLSGNPSKEKNIGKKKEQHE